jgi:CHASE3 domain sensor protein
VIAKLKKSAVLIGVVVLLGLIIANAYSTVQNLQRIRDNGRLRQQSAALQAEISGIQLNLADLEAGQRGYLLTGDSTYLQRYNEARQQLPLQFSKLQSGSAGRPQNERAIESQLESVTQAKLAEAEETIRLRQQGYRHRAFGIVDSNRGKQLMDQARTHVGALLGAESGRFSDHDRGTSTIIDRALSEILTSTLVLLTLTALAFGLLWAYSRSLEAEVARGKETLQTKTAQLESVALTVSQQLPALLRQMQHAASTFLNQFLDYLPVGGQAQVAEIKEMAEKSYRLVIDSVERSASKAA